MDYVGNMAAGTVILTFLGTVFSYVVLKPLNSAICDLRETIRDMRQAIRNNESRWHELDVKITRIAQDTVAAHQRIDTLEKEL